jgi:GNAT superfamily N-acetyltransferase
LSDDGLRISDDGLRTSNDGLRIVSAASVSLAEFAAAFTAAFDGYQFPIILDAARLSRRVRQEQYDLEHSLIAYEGGEVMGMAALAVRADVGWVAGLGVVPARRGRGFGHVLMAALLGRARACGLRRLSLEVLASNTAARRIYEGAGMRIVRALLLLERAGGGGEEGRSSEPERRQLSSEPESRQLKEAEPAELLSHFARLHALPPQWSRGLPSLLVKVGMRGLYLGERERPDAYALLTEAADEGVTYLSDLAAADAESARELCAALGVVPGTLKIINEPEHSLLTAALLEHGFVEIERQYEMLIEL